MLNNNAKKTVHGLRRLAFLFLMLPFFLAGCDLATNTLKTDRGADLQTQDFRDGLAERLPEVEENESLTSASIPSLQPYVAASGETGKAMPLVSISVNQSVPLRDVLFELARQAEYDIELDPRIQGSIIFTARERPFDQVIERISEIGGLRYKFEDDTLRVELDTPYNKTYKIDYLSYVRSNQGSVRTDINVVSGDGADTGSSFQSSSQSESNFWGELETNLTQIIGVAAGNLRTESDPEITAAEQSPDVQAVAPTTDAEGNVVVQPPNAVLQVQSLPVGGGVGGGAPQVAQSFSVNRQAGLISVLATDKTHKEVEAYMKLLRRAVTSQVLIEAKILEVALTDQYSTGIDWRALNLFSGEFGINYLTQQGLGLLDTALSPSRNGSDISVNEGVDSNSIGGIASLPPGFTGDTSSSSFVVGYAGNDVQALIRAISDFGTVRALASPRLTVLNNQSAVLNVATNRVFFEIDIDVTNEDGTTQTEIDSEIRNVPEGVLVNVQPSINLDDGTISMAVRPTVTKVVRDVPDPGVAYVAATTTPPINISSTIPELNVQEIDSVIQVRSGQPIVMGGLLQDRTVSAENGVPVLSETPVIGSLFKQHDDQVQKTELIIFLKATILDSPSESIHNTDRDIYRRFSSDRRPFKM